MKSLLEREEVNEQCERPNSSARGAWANQPESPDASQVQNGRSIVQVIRQRNHAGDIPGKYLEVPDRHAGYCGPIDRLPLAHAET